MKNMLQSAGDALEKGQESHFFKSLQKLNFNPVYGCFPHLKRGLLFFSARKSIVLRDTHDDRDFRAVNKNKVERISKHRRD